MIAHHDNIKPCVLPAREGVTHCPAPEEIAIHLLAGEPTLRCQMNVPPAYYFSIFFQPPGPY